MPDELYLAALQRVITEIHGCNSIHIDTIRVKETFSEVVIWSGNIEIFGVDHPRAHRCFAWIRDRHQDVFHAPSRVFAVLESTTVHTPEEAAKFVRIGETADLVEQFCRWGQDFGGKKSPAAHPLGT